MRSRLSRSFMKGGRSSLVACRLSWSAHSFAEPYAHDSRCGQPPTTAEQTQLLLPYRSPLNLLLVPFAFQNSLYVNAGRVDQVGVEVANFHQVLNLGDGHSGGGCHHGIKISCRL